jgi:transcriptional regulator with XRE-family HTH domain
MADSSFDLGEFIREQRRNAQISVRQLAKLAGVSNPYLSQIERGLRRPSAEILQQIAKGLRISAEALYVQAGILDERIAGGAVVDVVLADTSLTERQKQVMLEVYDSFRKENQRRQTDEERLARIRARTVPHNDAFAAVVDDPDTGDPRDLDAEEDDEELVGSDAAPPTGPMRTTMTRQQRRR